MVSKGLGLWRVQGGALALLSLSGLDKDVSIWPIMYPIRQVVGRTLPR